MKRHPNRGPGWAAVALPAEHGSWSLVLEPLALGLAVAPSAAAALVALGVFAAFLADRPVKTWLSDRRRGRSYPRTTLARRFALVFGGLSVAGMAGAVAVAGPEFLVPLALASPLGAVYLWFDRRPGRSWQAEIAAPAAVAAASAALGMASGWPAGTAGALWGLAAARSVPSVLYVRERLRLERGGGARRGLVVSTHVLAGLGVVALAALEWAPRLAVLPFVLLLARAAFGLSRMRRPAAARVVGVGEIFWGLLVVVLLVAAYRLPGAW